MANTFTKIASVTVGSGGTGSITFSSIPQTYTDLYLLTSLKSARATEYDYPYFRVNTDTSSYGMTYMVGNGSTVSGYTDGGYAYWTVKASGGTTTASTFSNTKLYIPRYASAPGGGGSTPIQIENVSPYNGSAGQTMFGHFSWEGNAAINQIIIYNGYSTTWVQYSTATLYGIKNS